MSNEAFAGVKIDALLAAQGWDTLDTHAIRFEVKLPDGTRTDDVLCERHDRLVGAVAVLSEVYGDLLRAAGATVRLEEVVFTTRRGRARPGSRCWWAMAWICRPRRSSSS